MRSSRTRYVLATGGFLTVLAGLWSWNAVTADSARPTGRPAKRASSPAAANQPGDLHLGSSSVYVHVGKTGLGHEHAVSGKLQSGTIQLGVKSNAGRLVFDMTSFDADSDTARQYIGLEGSTDASTREQVNANMLGRAVLDVQQFPTATLQIGSAVPLGRKSERGLPLYQLEGDFTLHGVTRPVKILADVEEKQGWLQLRGGFPILQTQYGIRPFSKAFGAIGVADRLQIWGDLWIAR